MRHRAPGKALGVVLLTSLVLSSSALPQEPVTSLIEPLTPIEFVDIDALLALRVLDAASRYPGAARDISRHLSDERATRSEGLPRQPIPNSIEVTVDAASMEPADTDAIAVSLVPDARFGWAPAYVASGEVAALPSTLTLVGVVPGRYYVAVCYDVDGDDLLCDGPGDRIDWFADGVVTVTLDPGGTVAIDIDLDR